MPKSIVSKILPLSLAVSTVIAANAAFAQQSKIENVEVVNVTGIRQSLQRAVDLKRYASSIQDSIVSEDIGKFPDQNLAESLQRITGVAISRVDGEGSKITVRGFGPKFNLVQLNGRTLATTDRGREFDFQILPAELIDSADLIKAPRANIPEGSLGAYVNTTTARPLDRPGFTVAGSAQLKYQDLSEEVDPRVAFTVSNTFADDTLGVLFSAALSDSTNRIDSYETAIWGRANPADEPGPFTDVNGSDVTERVWYPGRLRYSLAEEERERASANLTLQWAPSENFVNTFDAFYSDLSLQKVTNGLQIPLQQFGWTDALVSENLTALSARKDGSVIDGLFRVLSQESETFAFGLNSKMFLGDWTVEADLSYSTAESQPGSVELVPQFVNQAAGEDADPTWAFDGIDYIDFDSRTDVASVSSTIDWSDPSTLRSHFNNFGHNEREDEVLEASLDGSLEMDFGVLKSLDIGARITDRKKEDAFFRIVSFCNNPAFPRPDDLTDPSRDMRWENSNICNSAFDLPDSLFASNNPDFLSDVRGEFPRNFVAIPDINAYVAEHGRLRSEPDWSAQVLRPNSVIDNTEKTNALYVQANLEGDFDDIGWSGNVGLRYVDTKTTSSGLRVQLLGITPNWTVGAYNGENGWPLIPEFTENPVSVTESKSYSNVLPSANLTLDFNNGFQVRAAASQVITRPALEDIGVNRNYAYNRAEFFSSSGGNPNLNPYKANQFDLSFEFYGEGGNAYVLSYFYKDISDFITTDVETRSTGIVLPDYSDANGPVEELFTGKVNVDGGTVSGLEVAAIHYLDYLPGLFSGFGLQANYTYLETDGDSPEPSDVPGVTTPRDPLEGFSKDSYNFIAFYDKHGFQARLAYNWRSGYLKALSGASSRGQLAEHVDDYGQFDFSTSYDITDNITISGEVINLTNERNLEYADIRERVTLVQYNGVRYQLGVRAKF